MTQEDKDLLIKDLCARLPYGVEISVNDDKVESLQDSFRSSDTREVKPQLLPLSSMTEEQEIIYGGFVYEMAGSSQLETQKRINEFYWL